MIAIPRPLSSFSRSAGPGSSCPAPRITPCPRGRRLQLRVSQYLVDGGIACENAAQTILPQCNHSELNCLLFQSDCWCALIDQFAHRIGNFQELINPFSSFVTGVVTRVAAFAVIKLFFANVSPRNPRLRK